jgi:potassium large conductance calcium-activated channel subfamily M alpha protein 1
MFLHKRRFRERVAYFTGNLSYEEDIARCDIRSAAAYFSLTSKASLDANMDDQNTLFRLFAIRSFDPTLEIFVQVTLPRTAMQIKALFGDHNMTEKCQASDVNVLCLKEMSLNILASNCLTPGIATLLSAWMRKERTIVADGLSWLAEYSYGLSNSMFSAKIPSSLKGRSFGDVCRILFTAFNVYSFAIVASSQSQRHAGHEILREPSIKESRSEPDFALLLTRKLHLLQSKKLADMQKKVDAIGSKARVVICPPLDTPVDEHDVVFLLGIDPAISVKISNLSAETVMKIDRELSEVVCTEVPNTPLSASSRGTASLRLVRRHSFTAVPYVTVPSFFLSDASSSESFRRNGSCFSTMDSRLISEPSDDLLAAGRFVRERLGCRLHPAAIAAEYYLLSQPRQFSDAFVTNYTGIGHVVISGDPTAIEHFVFPLRSKRCGAVVPIVILCNRKSIEEAERAVFGPIRGFSLPAVSSWWHQICVFPEIFVLEGCSAYTSDLDRCNFRAASHVVSFPSREDSIAHGGASDHFLERNSDFLPIITHHHVRIAGVSRAQMGMRSPQSVVEVCSAPSVRLLSAGCASHMVDAAHDDHLDNHGFGLHRHPKNSAVDDAFLSAEFASGRVLVDTIFDSMLVHSFFQTHTKDIFAQLLTRFGSSMSRDCEPLRLGDTMHNVVKVRVPETFHGQPFEALFHHSLMNGQGIPIGLMRPRGFMSASAEYVYGTPRRDSILHPDDSVFMFIRDLIGHPE